MDRGEKMNRIERFENKYWNRFRKAVRTVLAANRGYGDLTDKDGQEAIKLLGPELVEEMKNAFASKDVLSRHKVPGSTRN